MSDDPEKCAVCGEGIKKDESKIVNRTSAILIGLLRHYSNKWYGKPDVCDMERVEVDIDWSDYEIFTDGEVEALHDIEKKAEIKEATKLDQRYVADKTAEEDAQKDCCQRWCCACCTCMCFMVFIVMLVVILGGGYYVLVEMGWNGPVDNFMAKTWAKMQGSMR